MKAIILISEASLPLAKTLQRELPDTLIYTKNECEGCISITSCHRFIEEHFNDFDSIIFIGAMGICVRSIAGCIKNKYKDPAVVCVDSTGRFVISVLSGHVGGANALARRIAGAIGAQAVVTTATDGNGVFAVDTWAAGQGFLVMRPGAAKAVSAALLNGEPVGFYSDFPVEGPLPKGIVPAKEGKVGIRISLAYEEMFQATCWILPRILTLGIGCKRGTEPIKIQKAVDSRRSS